MNEDITITITKYGLFLIGYGRMVNIPNQALNSEPARTLPETIEFLTDALQNDPAGTALTGSLRIHHMPEVKSNA